MRQKRSNLATNDKPPLTPKPRGQTRSNHYIIGVSYRNFIPPLEKETICAQSQHFSIQTIQYALQQAWYLALNLAYYQIDHDILVELP
jgi:hypothetical protein